MGEEMTEARAWVIFDKSKIVGTRKTNRFDLHAGQRAVELVLRYPSSLFQNEYPTVTVQVDDKREILDREIGVEVGGDEDQSERQVVDPQKWVEELVQRLYAERELVALPRWAHAAVCAELDHKQDRQGAYAYDYESGLEEIEGEAVRYIRLLD